ncbi:30S ribosomal protein S12 methylthiotransferase RimO [Peptoniphilus equinus]|uniref:Ribosomal protein uS12 methylthiotransferase RimO n=1 Tax=Peptoniphilus equinus TaxID=3016343 RepID=A0ABY7QV76_9FIRM|nr:30S ribosomal protein S12 methylthiotransferase RimO [Peptoniphilus equinus]WBW50687.1 30S ribosomal protein S12 methylthiotransferase RimO [Peptoniphilus equinus]
MNKVHFITLGCSKNDVDTSTMVSYLNAEKYELTQDPTDADAIIVNTCGFIDSAKEQSIQAILESAKLKEKKLKKLIMAGCLAERYAEELIEAMPEVDGIIGTGSFQDVESVLDRAFDGDRPIDLKDVNSAETPVTFKKNPAATEYVRISEGCNNNCSYCIIPKLRGRNKSRAMEDIYQEVAYLTGHGTKEIILIAQNSTDYGIDLYGDFKLLELIQKLTAIESLKWLRILYLYPDTFSDELVNEFKTNEKLLNYVDIPLQHISNRVLKVMNRKTSKEDIIQLITKLKTNVPNICIRSTFIVGFPTETDEEFQELLDFISAYKLNRVGAFAYSREEGTASYDMAQVEDSVKMERLDELMALQQDISAELLASVVGSTLDILVEEKIEDELYRGRSYLDAPDIDGDVYVKASDELQPGELYPVLITGATEFDLEGRLI